MRFAGIDLAWKSEKNTSAMTFGHLDKKSLYLDEIYPAVDSLDRILSIIKSKDDLTGIAIDAPLIIKNKIGQRECETLVGKDYGARGASCHTSNTDRYPNAASVKLSRILEELGFKHLQNVAIGKFQIECYPHPAIIEMFELERRLLYKKGDIASKKCGQIELASHIKNLEKSKILPLTVDHNNERYLSEERINSLIGAELKQNEDVLDSIICLYVAALFAISAPHETYGSIKNGYIYVPQIACLTELF